MSAWHFSDVYTAFVQCLHGICLMSVQSMVEFGGPVAFLSTVPAHNPSTCPIVFILPAAVKPVVLHLICQIQSALWLLGPGYSVAAKSGFLGTCQVGAAPVAARSEWVPTPNLAIGA